MVKENQITVGHCDTLAKIYQRSTFASSGQSRRIQQHLNELSFDFCKNCYNMPSLPQGAFAACKLRAQNQKNMQVATNTPNKPDPTQMYNSNRKLMDYTPVKYNEKFMNAVWGHYNRYSPHNIKSNDAAIAISSNFVANLTRENFSGI